MTSHQLEIRLKSVDESRDWDEGVTLRIVAYIKGTDAFNENTLIFDCSPTGSNYKRTYLKVEFPHQEAIANIHQFLANHLQKDDGIERSLQIPIVNAKRVITRSDGHRSETEDSDYLQVAANSERISFGPLGMMAPSIRFYETATKEGPQDQKNGKRLLSFFDEIIDDRTRQLSVSLQDDELVEQCLPLFEDGRYKEASRLAGQILEERVAELAPDSLNDVDGSDLMRQSFSPNDGPLQIASREGEQVGLMSMFAGSYQAIRNPLSHRTPDPDGDKYLDDLDRAQAKNILHIIDYLLTTLERNLR